MKAKLLVADDEAELAADLHQRLQRLWPQATVAGVARNGPEARALLQERRPDVAFLDIRMPGMSGLEVAAQIDFPCHVVFVTAYDQYAVEAFEREAVDYLLKPVSDERLVQTIDRLQRLLAGGEPPAMRALLERLEQTLGAQAADAAQPLRWIRASAGERLRLLPVDEVDYFQARDKYTSVLTAEGEFLIRTPVRELAAQLDGGRFWQIHRATIVNVARVAAVTRDFGGRLTLTLRGREESLTVSRRYTHLFERM